MSSVKALAEEPRRVLQQEAGFTVVKRRPAPANESKKRNMEQSTQTHQQRNRGSQAQQSIDKLNEVLGEPPTFGQVAVHELKRAAVWVPMLFTTGAALLLVNKRFFMPRVAVK
jgi:hypothetical protein